jgi:Kef-type K+ transport system membrane component KefB
MLLGRSVISWIVWAFFAVCLFILAKWAIPLLFALVGVAIPEQIVTILALLIALGFFWGWHSGAWTRAGPA